jgi:hypothetical protein
MDDFHGKVPAAVYTRHAGLYLPKNIRDQLFDYTNYIDKLRFWPWSEVRPRPSTSVGILVV